MFVGLSAWPCSHALGELTSRELFESVSDSWKSSSFSCQYQLRDGVISSRAMYDEEDYPLPSGRTVFEDIDPNAEPEEVLRSIPVFGTIHGAFHKRKDLLLITDFPVDASKAMKIDHPSGVGQATVMSGMRYEHLSNQAMQISYVHDGQKTSVGRAGLTVRGNNSCGFAHPMVTPISPTQSCDYERTFSLTHPPMSEKISSVDGRRMIIDREWSYDGDAGGLLTTRRDFFDLSFPRPVLVETRYTFHERLADGNRGPLITKSCVRLSDHVDCGEGIFLAKKVLEVIMIHHQPSEILVHEWTSENLGDRPPRDSDFVIEVKGLDDTIGFKNGQQRIFTFADLDMNLKQQPGGIEWGPKGDPSSQPPKVLVPRSRTLSLLIWANLIGLPVLAIYLVRRLRRSAKES